jgi:hypothetical protein
MLVMPGKAKKQKELELKDIRVRPVAAPQHVADWAFKQIRVTLNKSK